MITPASVTHGIAFLSLIGMALIVLYVFGLPWRNSALRAVYAFAGTNALLGAFLVTIGAMFGSLYFSEIAKYPPCDLCWYQRILMYPQVVLIGLALMKKNRDVIMQVRILSGLGLIIALYHVYLQSGGTALVPCSATGSLAVPCGVKNFQEFGFVTIPVMALTGYVLLLIATALHRVEEMKNTLS